MNLTTFLLLLLIISTMTGLFTEGIKKFLDGAAVKYSSNAVAGIVAVVLSILISVGYIIIVEATLTAALFVYLIALVLLSWLCSMIGYDKVVQAITQLSTKKKEE